MHRHDDDVASVSRRIVTLEQFIVDTFTRIDEDGIERAVDQPDQIGGGGTYAIIGSRMFAPPSRLGMIIDYTPSTLPGYMRDTLNGYAEEMWVYRERTDGHPTARAVNRYNGQTRGFEYLTKPLLLTPQSLLDTSLADPLPSTIHLISYPAPRIEGILSEVHQLKNEKRWNPIVVWEPEEESLEVIERVAKDIDLIGPNHREALRLFSPSISSSCSEQGLKELYSETCRRLVSLKPKIGVVVRCGHLGCCYASTPTSGDEVKVKWVPAYWNPQRPGWTERVVKDPTGAGNAFMGGLAAALDLGNSLDEGVIWGSVAASFTIEQDGLPAISRVDGDGEELWNGEDPWERVREIKMEMDVERI